MAINDFFFFIEYPGTQNPHPFTLHLFFFFFKMTRPPPRPPLFPDPPPSRSVDATADREAQVLHDIKPFDTKLTRASRFVPWWPLCGLGPISQRFPSNVPPVLHTLKRDLY